MTEGKINFRAKYFIAQKTASATLEPTAQGTVKYYTHLLETDGR